MTGLFNKWPLFTQGVGDLTTLLRGYVKGFIDTDAPFVPNRGLTVNEQVDAYTAADLEIDAP